MDTAVAPRSDEEGQPEQLCITELSLSGKHLTLLPPDLVSLRSLHFLDLSNNCLTRLPADIKLLLNLYARFSCALTFAECTSMFRKMN